VSIFSIYVSKKIERLIIENLFIEKCFSFFMVKMQVINYPTWHSGSAVKGDLVLVKLDLPVQFSRIASPLCLPQDPSQTFAGQTGTTIGWGITETGASSKFLRQVRF